MQNIIRTTTQKSIFKGVLLLLWQTSALAAVQVDATPLYAEDGSLLGYAHVFHPEDNDAGSHDTQPVVFLPGFDLDIAETFQSALPTQPGSRQAGLDIIRKLKLTTSTTITGNHFLESLVDEHGHTIVALEYADDSAGVQRNARALAQLLGDDSLPVKQRYQRSGTQSIVIGWSMGGLVARLALAEMEEQQKNHYTSLFVSYDVPHRGARLPLSLEAFSHVMLSALSQSSTAPALDSFASLLTAANEKYNSQSAKEMLIPSIGIANQGTNLDALRTRLAAVTADPENQAASPAFYQLRNTLFSLGQYPENVRKVAVSNGNMAFAPLPIPYPRDRNLLARLTARVVIGGRFNIRMLDVRLREDATTRTSSGCSVYYYFRTVRCPSARLPSLNDAAVGSYTNVVERLVDAFKHQETLSQEWESIGYEVEFTSSLGSGEGKTVFIPLYSAFDIAPPASGNDLLTAINNSPFDALYANVSTNENHNSVSSDVATALLSDMRQHVNRQTVFAALPSLY